MSGPTTALFGLDAVAILLAAAAIQASQAVQEGYAEAAAQGGRQAEKRAAASERQSAAAASGQAALTARIEAAEADHARLCTLTAPYGLAEALAGNKPAVPVETSHAALAAYLEQLLARNAHLSAALDGMLAALPQTHAAGLSDAALAAPQTLPPAAETWVPQAAAARLIARLAGLGPLPPAIEALAAELAAATSQERRELLEVELRRAIQAYQREAAEKASALVLEHTLRELGYQVEPIAETLFVEGGVVHFRRAGWGDYQVRLRLDAAGKSVNFNIVRAVDAGDNERSVLDHVAEDRWCAEFPALLRALGERGLRLEVTRRLEAGELPVQLVERSRLPRFAESEANRPQRAPLARELR
ncbi:MAG: hypothetical protein ACK5JI_06655 [Azonexus sp.]